MPRDPGPPPPLFGAPAPPKPASGDPAGGDLIDVLLGAPNCPGCLTATEPGRRAAWVCPGCGLLIL